MNIFGDDSTMTWTSNPEEMEVPGEEADFWFFTEPLPVVEGGANVWTDGVAQVGIGGVPVPGVKPTITATVDDTIVVNANNDNWKAGGTQSQWLSADQKYIPKVRDFNATNLWQDDPQLVPLTICVGGWYGGVVAVDVYSERVRV